MHPILFVPDGIDIEVGKLWSAGLDDGPHALQEGGKAVCFGVQGAIPAWSNTDGSWAVSADGYATCQLEAVVLWTCLG